MLYHLMLSVGQAGRAEQSVQVQQEPIKGLPPSCLHQRTLAMVSTGLLLGIIVNHNNHSTDNNDDSITVMMDSLLPELAQHTCLGWDGTLRERPPRWPSGKASASRAEDPGFESRLRRDFFGVKSYQ